MAENSAIEWTDHTVNFWIGCTRVSPACDHCYAERDWSMTGRFARVEWGPHGERSPTKDPMREVARIAAGAAKRSRRERVFINSLSDWADNHKSISDDLRASIFDAARLHPGLDLILLTKRPQNIARYLPGDWGDGYRNVWLGVTAENQEEADRRIPILLATPAAVRWVSAEPLLGAINLRIRIADRPRLDWIVVGGESGAGARPMHPAWTRSIRDQCAEAGVPFFHKQNGEWAIERPRPGGDLGGDMRSGVVRHVCADRQNDGHFRAGDVHMRRVGKARAGRLLDGREHNDMPEPAR